MSRYKNPDDYAEQSGGAIFVLFCDVLSILVFTFLMMYVDADQIASLVPGLTQKVHSSELALGLALEKSEEKSGVIDGLEEEAAGNRERIEEQGRQIVQLSGELQKTLDRLRSGPPVRLVFCLDVTASMQSVVDELRTVLGTVLEVIPNTSKKCEISVLAFRGGVVEMLPLMEIEPVYDDQGVSQKMVLDFIDGLQVENAHTEHLTVFKQATEILNAPSTDETLHRLILLGDVGPAELDKQVGYTAEEREMKDRILAGVRRWATMRPNNAVTSLYADSDWSLQDPASDESRAWFEQLGSVSDSSAFYATTSSLLRAVLHASLNQGD